MKKLLLLFTLIFTFSIAKSQCHYVVDMQDSYGDGWNGASINVSINGAVVGNFTVPLGGLNATDSISTYTGDNVSFDFISGTWDTEITFTITAPDGSSVGSFGPYTNNSGNDGNIWSGVSNSTCAPPACLDPYGLSAGNISSSSVDISWSAGPNAASFNIEYGPTGYSQGSGTTTTSSTTSATVSGLSGYTTYDFYIQSDCQASSNGISNWAGPLTATTCPGAAPYMEDFNNGVAACWSQESQDIFDWTILSGATTSLTTGPTDDVSGGGSYIYIESSAPRAPGDSAIMYTPSIDVSALTAAQLRFYSHMYGASISTLRIDASADGGNTYSTVFSKSGDQGDQWNEEMVDLSNYTSSVSLKIVGYVGDDGSGVQYWGDIAIDNFELRNAPSCVRPSNLAAANITSSTVDLSWNAGGNETSWNIEYGPVGFTSGSGITTTANSTSTTVSGLTDYTNYDFYVQADCQSANNGVSIWEGPINVHTCPGSAPYLETYDNGSPCWMQSANDIFDWLSFSGPTTSVGTGPTDDITGGGNYMYIETSNPRVPGDSATMMSPSIDISTLTAAQLKFFTHMFGGATGTLSVDISSDGGSTFTNVFSKSGDQGDQWNEETVNLSSYTGSVMFKITANVTDDGAGVQFTGDIAIDNFELREMPSCPKPTNLVGSNISASSADLSWTPGSSETSWNVEFGAAGFSLGSGTAANVSATNYTMTGLTSQTDYDFYVQGVCSSSDLSNWAGPFSFTTPPGCGETVTHCYGAGAYSVFTAVVDNPGDMIKLDINAGETEVGYDSLQIWDGIGNNGNLLYSADGDHTGGMGLSTTGTITLYVKGDGNYNCQDGLGGPYAPFDVTISCITPAPVDMEMTSLSMASVLGAGPNNITGTVTSYGSNPISSFDITWNDGSGANTETFNVNMNFGDTYSFTHGTPLNVVGGQNYTLTVDVSASNDANANNNSITNTYSSVSQILPKIVIGEEKTGEWCGWCPRGAVGMVEMAMNYPNDFIGIAVHNGDGMVVQAYDANIGNYIPGGYPGAGVDRVIDGDPSTFVNMMNQRKAGYVPVGGVTPTATYDANNVTVDVSADFVASISGDHRIAVVLLGDSILGAGQANYYDGGGSGPMAMPNYGSMPNLDFATAGSTISPFYHDHVAVALGNNEINGTSGSVPSTVNAGDNVNYTYTFARQSSWNLNKMHAVAMLVDGSTGEILNSSQSPIVSGSVGIKNPTGFQTLLYPNPSNGIASLVVHLNSASKIDISVINILGEEVYRSQSGMLSSGGHINQIDLSSNANGIYFVRVNANQITKTIKLTLKN
jgi:hypothetical protein